MLDVYDEMYRPNIIISLILVPIGAHIFERGLLNAYQSSKKNLRDLDLGHRRTFVTPLDFSTGAGEVIKGNRLEYAYGTL